MAESTQGENPFGALRVAMLDGRALLLFDRAALHKRCSQSGHNYVGILPRFALCHARYDRIDDIGVGHTCGEKSILGSWIYDDTDSEDEANALFDELEASFVRG